VRGWLEKFKVTSAIAYNSLGAKLAGVRQGSGTWSEESLLDKQNDNL
jgi:hypothetical protein